MKTVALRDYQQKGILDIRAAMRSARSVLYVAPTGSGKTVLFVFIAQSAIALGNRVWILVHRQELLFQTSRSLDALGVSHGVVAPGFTPAPHELVQVCSVQTLRNRILQGRIGDVDLVVIDEAHHATAGSWRTILEARPRARFLGVTATPSRADGNGLGVAAGGVFDVMTLGPSVAHLMAEGYLCKAAVFAPPSQLDLTNLRLRGGDYEPKALAERVDRPTITGDAVSHYRRVCSGQPAIAFCASVAHAKHVAEQFRAAGFRSESIDGSMADTDRKRLIDALGTGKMHVLTSCEIVSEGTDIPVVAAAILLRPTQSLALHLQQVGRALRPVYVPGANVATREGRLSAIASSAKPRAVILDHVGNTLRHGLPDEGWEWSLEGKPKRGGGEGSAPALRVQQCEQCFAAFAPAPACPVCGFSKAPALAAPQQADGELVEITPEQAEFLKRERKREVSRAQTLDDLKAIARARGYKENWANIVWKQRQERVARLTPPPWMGNQ